MEKVVTYKFDFKKICLNIIILYAFSIFFSYNIIYILDLIYPVSATKIAFDDFYLIN